MPSYANMFKCVAIGMLTLVFMVFFIGTLKWIDGSLFHERRDALEEAATWIDAEQMLHPWESAEGNAYRFNALDEVKSHIREME